jgi:hypothetical protein
VRSLSTGAFESREKNCPDALLTRRMQLETDINKSYVSSLSNGAGGSQWWQEVREKAQRRGEL